MAQLQRCESEVVTFAPPRPRPTAHINMNSGGGGGGSSGGGIGDRGGYGYGGAVSVAPVIDSGDVGMVGEAVSASLAVNFAATFKCKLERETDLVELTVRGRWGR